MTSEAVPAAIAVPMEASNSFVPTYWMSMPVAASKSLTSLSNFTMSSELKGPSMVTLVPFILPL